MDILEVALLLPVLILEWPEDCAEDHGEVEYPPQSHLVADVDPRCACKKGHMIL